MVNNYNAYINTLENQQLYKSFTVLQVALTCYLGITLQILWNYYKWEDGAVEI